MAENAANFTFTFQNKPSIFEIIAQKSLNDTLHPALQRVALFLYTSNPSKFEWLQNNYEEFFLILNGLLQYHYLNYYNSSFSENFYGLKRILLDDKVLSGYDKGLSMVFLVVLPYLKRKLEDKLTIYKLEAADGTLQNDIQGILKKLAIFSHSSFELGYALALVTNYLKYLSNNTEIQLPHLYLLKMKLTYADEVPNIPGFWSALFRGQLSFSELSFGLIRNAVTSTLEVTAFFLQFLQTWNAEKANVSLTSLPIVPPPLLDNKSKKYKGKCPICLRPWINPTVLQVSGYIFCFRCLVRYVGEHQKCPITNLPAKSLNIVKLFV